jgi:two-component system chemotaxis sensor kinase CheA
VIALTTLAAEEDIARGKAAGVEEYHIKLDRELLVEGVCRHLRATVAA